MDVNGNGDLDFAEFLETLVLSGLPNDGRTSPRYSRSAIRVRIPGTHFF
jgi:hypothetical protein